MPALDVQRVPIRAGGKNSSAWQTQQAFLCMADARLRCFVREELSGCWAVEARTGRAPEAEVYVLGVGADAVYDQLLPLLAHRVLPLQLMAWLLWRLLLLLYGMN